MHIRVTYHDGRYDYVIQRIFQSYLDGNKIKQFYRHSEKKWVIIGIDPIRTNNDNNYNGIERRAN